MPRKSRDIANYAETSCKQDNEDGPSQNSVTQEPLPSRPTRAAKVKCLEQLPKVIGKLTPNLSRNDENYVLKHTSSDKCKQNKKNIKNKPKIKADESVEDYERRLEKRRQYELKRKTNESVEKRKEYLEKQRLYAINRRANETIEERDARLERERQHRLKHKEAESVDKLEQRRKKDRLYRLQCRANESAEQRKRRLERVKQYRLKRKANKCAKQCDKVSEKNTEKIKKQRHSESIEQNYNCLKKLLQGGPKCTESKSSKNEDDVTEGVKHIVDKEIKTEPSNKEYNNPDDKTLNEVTSVDSIPNNNIKNEHSVLLNNAFEVRVLKQEIDESETTLQNIFNEETNSMSDGSQDGRIVTNKDSNCIQTSLEKTSALSKSFVSLHSSDSSQEPLINYTNNSNKVSILSSMLSKPARAPQVPNIQQLLKSTSKDKPCSVNPGKNTEINLHPIIERNNASKRKINETVEEHELRLAKQREYEVNRKANENIEQKKQRLEKRRVYLSKTIANETVEQRERRLERQRQYELRRKINESPEQRQRRLARQRKYDTKRKANETVEQHEKFLERHRQIESKLRASKSAEQREQSKQRRRENRLKRIAKETVEQREQRLEKRRLYLSQKKAKQNSKQAETTKDKHDSVDNIKTKATNQESGQSCDNTTSESAGVPKANVHGDGKIHESHLVDNMSRNNNITEDVILLDEIEEVVNVENIKSKDTQTKSVDSHNAADIKDKNDNTEINNPIVQNNFSKTYIIRGIKVEVEIKSEGEDMDD